MEYLSHVTKKLTDRRIFFESFCAIASFQFIRRACLDYAYYNMNLKSSDLFRIQGKYNTLHM
jgi:hypothetical protein